MMVTAADWAAMMKANTESPQSKTDSSDLQKAKETNEALKEKVCDFVL